MTSNEKMMTELSFWVNFPFKNYMWYFFCIDIDSNIVKFDGSASSKGKPGLTDYWNHKNSLWPLHFYNAIMCMHFLQLLDYTVNTVVKSVCQMNSCTYFCPSSKRDQVAYFSPQQSNIIFFLSDSYPSE